MNDQTNKQMHEEEEHAVTLQKMMFDQMKRLSDPNADLDKEIKRSQALSSAGTVIINAAKVKIDAVRVANQAGKKQSKTSNLLGDGK